MAFTASTALQATLGRTWLLALPTLPCPGPLYRVGMHPAHPGAQATTRELLRQQNDEFEASLAADRAREAEQEHIRYDMYIKSFCARHCLSVLLLVSGSSSARHG